MIPAVGAARVTPIQAWRLGGRKSRRRTVVLTTLAAAVLLTVPILHVHAATDGMLAFRRHVFFDLPLMTVGLFAIAPVVLLALAGPVGRVLGWVLRVHPLLVSRHVLRTRWRSAAVVTALALCLTLVVASNTETESILAATKLPTSFPDLLVILPDGVERPG